MFVRFIIVVSLYIYTVKIISISKIGFLPAHPSLAIWLKSQKKKNLTTAMYCKSSMQRLTMKTFAQGKVVTILVTIC